MLPKETKIAMILAAQGQESYDSRRHNVGVDLAERDIVTILHCMPFYGGR